MGEWIDCHVHSSFSGDCRVPMEIMCRAALEKGLRGVAFTEHLELELVYPGENFDLDLEGYFRKILEITALFEPQLEIYAGIEIGLSGPALEEARGLCAGKPLDIIIGSVHGLDGTDLCYPSHYEGKDAHEVYERYLNAILNMARCFQDYSVIGHIGYISKYAPYARKEILLDEYAGILDDIFKTVIETGHGLELNTSGLQRFGLVFPSVALLTRYRQLGGEIVTMASDAHTPQALGACFDAASEYLKAAGFRYVAHYKALKPIFMKIP
jgi:histidinol-phosphatase (PHP family)